METIKVKSTDPKNQGPFVLINAEDFDEKVHKRYEDPKQKAEKPEKDSK